jgi:hypothetical protein
VVEAAVVRIVLCLALVAPIFTLLLPRWSLLVWLSGLMLAFIFVPLFAVKGGYLHGRDHLLLWGFYLAGLATNCIAAVAKMLIVVFMSDGER